MRLTLTKLLFCLILCLPLTACKQEEVYTRGMFLRDVRDKGGFSGQDLEALKAYGLIDSTEAKELEKELDRDYLAAVLLGFLSDKPFKERKLGDLVAYKLTTDAWPKKISRELALKCLAQVLQECDNQAFVAQTAAKFKTYREFREEDYKADTLKTAEDLKLRELVKIGKDYYSVAQKEKDKYHLKPAKIEDVYEEVKLSYDAPLDLAKIEVLDKRQTLKPNAYSDELVRRALNHFANVKTIGGYQVSYRIDRSAINVAVSKEIKDDYAAELTLRLSDIHPVFTYDYAKGKLKHAYFKLNFKSREELAFHRTKEKTFYADFADEEKETRFAKLFQLLKPQAENVATSFTICRFKIGIGGLETAELVLSLKLNLYLDGALGVSLETVNENGFEIRNNSLRLIRHNQHDLDGYIGADASSTVALSAAIALLNQNMLDIGVEGGIKAAVKTTAHLAGAKKEVALPYDLADAAFPKAGIPICGDLSFHWLLNVNLNSSDTLAGRLGLGRNYQLLNSDDQIFHNLSHLENGMFVEKCTRKTFADSIVKELDLDASALTLEKYAIVLKNKNYQINLSGIPKGYTLADLVYQSDKKAIATVDAQGLITAHQAGAAQIRIATKDNKYEVYLNVLVSTHHS